MVLTYFVVVSVKKMWYYSRVVILSYSLIVANFPWLEPLVLITIRNSEVGKSVQVLHSTALGLINERVQSKEPPKVQGLTC